jgi:hypothetical protein
VTALLALLVALAAGPTPDDRFVPPVERERGRVVLPLTFTDGTRAELRYPPALRLAERGVVPYGSGVLDGDSPHPGRSDRVARDFVIVHGDVDQIMARWDGGATLRRTYPGAGGGVVGLWELPPGDFHVYYLAFQFGRWAVLVHDFPPEFDDGAASMTEEERASWALSMSGWETAGGFLRLDATSPLRLLGAGAHAGPQLAFGAAGPLTLTPGRCRRTRHHDRTMSGKHVSWSRRHATWCVSRSMRADARGSRRWRRALIRGLDVG